MTIDQAALDRLVDAAYGAFRHDTAPQPRAAASPRTRAARAVTMRAEARPGRSCALIITEKDGSVGEAILDAATCREVAAALTRAAR